MKNREPSLESVDLGAIANTAWRLLQSGAASARDPFHTACLATSGDYGPSARTVVLREAESSERRICCHTDVRSLKVTEARGDPRCSWLFYDRERKLQLRLAGRLNVHTDDAIAERRWEETRAMGRACYTSEQRPGEPMPAVPGAPRRIANEAEESLARGHFAVLACQVEFLEWLLLSVHGHRRAQLNWGGNGWDAAWRPESLECLKPSDTTANQYFSFPVFHKRRQSLS